RRVCDASPSRRRLLDDRGSSLDRRLCGSDRVPRACVAGDLSPQFRLSWGETRSVNRGRADCSEHLPGSSDLAERKAEAGSVRHCLLAARSRWKPSPSQTDFGVGPARLSNQREEAPTKPATLRSSPDALGRAQGARLRSDRRRSSPRFEAKELKRRSLALTVPREVDCRNGA